MKTDNLSILIPALKNSFIFQDVLVKKLSGVSLIQRTINKAINLGVDPIDIHIITESEEINMIGRRNGVEVYWKNSELTWSEDKKFGKLSQYLKKLAKSSTYTLLLSPYAPLLKIELVNNALKAFIESKKDILKPVKLVEKTLYDENGHSIFERLFSTTKETHRIESKAFMLLKSGILRKGFDYKSSIFSWPVQNDLFEIDSYQDWWVCEKLLQRKRIVFRVIGNENVGMGHIYRTLSLAHEITDHEILFVSDKNHKVALNKLALLISS